MSLLPTNPLPANYLNAGFINTLNDGVNNFDTAQDGQGFKITNNTTSGYLEIGAGGFIVSPDGVSTFTIDPTNLTALAPNPLPNELVINDTLIVQNDDTTPTENFQLQAGINGGVGTFFGISYDSQTNQDFVIQTTNSNSGGVLFNQLGLGSTTTTTNIKQGTITITDPTNNYLNTITGIGSNPIATNPTQTYNANYNATGLGTSLVDTGGNFSITANCDYAGGLSYEYNDNAGNDTTISMKATPTQGTITCVNTGSPAPVNFIASQLLLNGSPVGGGSQNIEQVLIVGDNANGQSINGVNNLNCSTINSVSYPPPTPSWNDTLTANNTAYQSIYLNNNDINNVNNLQVATINGLSPITLGLTWGDFTGSNAYSNLPSQAYEVYSYPYTTTQSNSFFRVVDSSAPNYSSLTSTSLLFYDTTSSTSSTYSTNNLTITNGTDYTISQTGGANINLNCNQLVINGTAYTPPTPPPKRWGLYNNTGTSFAIGSGAYYNLGVGGSPIISLSGMTPSTSYTIGIQFTCIMDSQEPTGAIYLNYSNSNGGFTNCLFTGSRPCGAIANPNTFSAGNNTQFTIIDNLIFVSGTSGELYIDLYAGHNGGSWGGNYYWSFTAYIISP